MVSSPLCKSEVIATDQCFYLPANSSSLGSKLEDSDKEIESFRKLLESNVKELLEEVRLHEDEEFLAESDHGNQAGQDPPGRYYREMARQEAIRKRNAYEASKRAYKMGQGGEARRVSHLRLDFLCYTMCLSFFS